MAYSYGEASYAQRLRQEKPNARKLANATLSPEAGAPTSLRANPNDKSSTGHDTRG
ncbi:MAG: hypothetical protein PUP90_11505 [Nostoc sp. S4]|nr:hypothetical protein [Nostoc sp. S4]